MSTHKRQIFLDTETTGFNHSDPHHPDRMLEFAGIGMVNRQLVKNDVLHLRINPERDVPEEAANVHGITFDMLIDEPVFADVAHQIFDFIKDSELIIHNAKFDVGFLDAEFARVGLPNVESVCTVVDTLAMAREMFPGQKASLDALCTRFEVDRSKRIFHGALIDCELLSEVYLAMTRGQYSLMDDLQPSAAEIAASLSPRPEKLKVLMPSAEELEQHENYLNQLDKIVKGRCEYRAYLREQDLAEQAQETPVSA